MTPSPAPRDVPSLLRALQASDPGRPRITWYGAGGERVELSARVLDNWVAKTGNLLAEELDAGPGTTVRLDLPMHWRTVVWALATWAVGAELSDDDADVVVTTSPDGGGAGNGHLVAVALPALARAVPGLPPGVLDYNAEVGQHADELLGTDLPTVLPAPSGRWPGGTRVLAVTDGPVSPWDVVDVLVADGSLVLVESTRSAEADHLAEQERAVARLRPGSALGPGGPGPGPR